MLSAIAVLGCGGVYVTHIHELTQQVDRFNAVPGRTGCIDNLVAQMENVADRHPQLPGAPHTPPTA